MAKLLTHVLLPLLVFSLLDYAAYPFLFRTAGLRSHISAVCNADLAPQPYRLPYTNIPRIDQCLCILVAFFHTLMDLAYNPLFAVLFPAVGIVALVPFLEAARDHRPFALTTPTTVGVLFQLYSMGLVMPIYALLFVITGNASLRPVPTLTLNWRSKINQGNAEALLFGILVGYALPTILMLYLDRPSVTAIWQGFPPLIALSIFAHKVIRPPSRLVHSGHTTVLVTLALSFALSALLHAIYVWPVLTNIASLRTLFVPVALTDASDPVATLPGAVLEFIKWDIIFGVGAVMLATLWMADGLSSLLGILAWHAVATIALGPAAAIAGVFLWREIRLNGRSRAENAPKKRA